MYGIFRNGSATRVLGAAVMAAAVAGCDWDAKSASFRQQENGVSAGKPRADAAENVLPGWIRSERPVLRHRLDAARGRLWTLTAAGVELHEITTRQRVAKIELPGWLLVGEQYAFPPDLAIGPNGEVVVSSNVVPTLWRIDPGTLVASKHELVLDDDTGRDIGFTGLTYSAQQGAFFAISPFQGSLWRIDPLLRRGQRIPMSAPLPNARGLGIRERAPDQAASRFVELCVRADQNGWIVNLTPDQRSGYVRAGSCEV